MKPGTLGIDIPENGSAGGYAWESLGLHEATQVYDTLRKNALVATLYGSRDVRLERVAALIGYLEDEARASHT